MFFSKKYILFFMCAVSAYGVAAALDTLQDRCISPETTAFVCNFDTLIAAPERLKIAWGSTTTVFQHPWTLMLLFDPAFYRTIVRTITKNMYADGKLDAVTYLTVLQQSHRWFTRDAQESLLRALYTYKPYKEVCMIMELLRKKGYRVYVVTKHSEHVMHNYIKPYMKKEYKIALDTIVDGYFCANNKLRFPDAKMFEHMQQAWCHNGCTQLIYFDTSACDIPAATHGDAAVWHACHVPSPAALKYSPVLRKIFE